jgi:hypothetical protein
MSAADSHDDIVFGEYILIAVVIFSIIMIVSFINKKIKKISINPKSISPTAKCQAELQYEMLKYKQQNKGASNCAAAIAAVQNIQERRDSVCPIKHVAMNTYPYLHFLEKTGGCVAL